MIIHQQFENWLFPFCFFAMAVWKAVATGRQSTRRCRTGHINET